MESLRVVTINFWGTEAPLDARLALAMEQLRAISPDVIGMQEVRPLNGRDGRTTADVLGDALNMERVYEITIAWQDDDFFAGHPGGQEGLAILSRWPIREHRVLRLPEARKTEARILLSACIAHPSGDVWVHTTHLHYRLDDGIARERQVVAIDEAIKAIETSAPQVLCGDFNATPEHDEIRFLRSLTTLANRRTHYQDAWLRAHPHQDGHTWCSENEHTRPLRSLDIDRRIDYIFVTTRKKDGRGTVLSCELALTGRNADGLAASDHYGLVADVQLSAN